MLRYLSQAPGALSGRARKLGIWVGLLGLTCLFLLGMAGFVALRMPLSLITRNTQLPPVVTALHGSAWAGQASLNAGYSIRWNTRIYGLPVPHFQTDLRLEGPDTRVTGWLETGLGGVALTAVEGRAGKGLAGLMPGTWTCDMTAVVIGVSAFWGWRRAEADGVIETPEGFCSQRDRNIDLPPLRIALSTAGVDAVARVSGDGIGQLGKIRLARDRFLDITIEPAASGIFPTLPKSGPINLQLPF